MAATQTVSYSETDTARQCLHKHRLAYKERWVTITKSPALNRGTLWHAVLEDFYLTIQFFQQVADGKWPDYGNVQAPESVVLEHAFEAGMAHLRDDRGAWRNDDAELIGWMFDGYIRHYGIDPDWKIVGVEQPYAFYLNTETGGRSRFKLKMKLDLVVRDLSMNRILVVDHKSGKNLPYDKELDIDDQFGLYIWGLKQAGKNVFGAMHSAARTHRNKDQAKNPQELEDRFKRTNLYRTDKELDAIALDAYRTMKLAYSLKPGEEPRSPNTDTCRWRCDYLESCLAGRKGMDEHEVMRGMGMEQNFTRHG